MKSDWLDLCSMPASLNMLYAHFYNANGHTMKFFCMQCLCVMNKTEKHLLRLFSRYFSLVANDSLSFKSVFVPC